MDDEELLKVLEEALDKYENNSNGVEIAIKEAMAPERHAEREAAWQKQIVDCLNFFNSLSSVKYRSERFKDSVVAQAVVLGIVFEDACDSEDYSECGEDIRELVELYYDNDWLFETYEPFTYKIKGNRQPFQEEVSARVAQEAAVIAKKVLLARGLNMKDPDQEFLKGQGLTVT